MSIRGRPFAVVDDRTAGPLLQGQRCPAGDRGDETLTECDYLAAAGRLDAALLLYRELDDAHGIARTLQVLGSVAREQGRYARSLELHAESLAIAEAAGDQWELVELLREQVGVAPAAETTALYRRLAKES